MNGKLLKKSIIILPANDKKAAELIYDILKEQGFNPVAMRDWRDTQEFFIVSSPDLIVMNLDKPDDEAFENLKLLRKCTKAKDVPTIIISSSERSDFDGGFPLKGKETFFTKPVPADDLLSTVKKMITKK